MLMRQKTKVTHFSSEDSKNTDDSLGSSIEIEEYNLQNNNGNKFNQLRETMNQIFLANPELAEEIKFEKYLTDEGEPEPFRHFSLSPSPSPVKKSVMASGASDPYSGMLEDQGTELSSGKFWSAISKEMTKPQKNSKLPSLNQINHILNIFKTTFEKPDVTSFSPVKPSSAQKKSKSEFRIQSAKMPNDKQGSGSKGKDMKGQSSGMNSPQYSSVGIPPDNAEDGLKYYSFRNKMHLKLKQKRVARLAEESKKKKELQAEREKLAQEMEQNKMNANLAELEKGIIAVKMEGDDHGEYSGRNTVKPVKPRTLSRKNSVKPKGDIFERLTKDMTKSVPEEEEEPPTKRNFTSQFAQTLYKDMKAFGDTEAFKKVAQSRIMNYKKEFKEKLAKQKPFPTDALRFNKNKSRYLNMFVPDFEKTVPIQNKEAIFVLNEVQKDSEEWKQNPENEILAKLKKIKGGNILEFWQEMKDIINQ